MHANSREALETRPPPLRVDARSSQVLKHALLHPARDRGPKSRGGAPRGERSRKRRRRKLVCVEREAHRWKRGNARPMRLRAYVIGPRTGAAAPERLSALRSLACTRETANLGGHLPRENDGACAESVPSCDSDDLTPIAAFSTRLLEFVYLIM